MNGLMETGAKSSYSTRAGRRVRPKRLGQETDSEKENKGSEENGIKKRCTRRKRVPEIVARETAGELSASIDDVESVIWVYYQMLNLALSAL